MKVLNTSMHGANGMQSVYMSMCMHMQACEPAMCTSTACLLYSCECVALDQALHASAKTPREQTLCSSALEFLTPYVSQQTYEFMHMPIHALTCTCQAFMSAITSYVGLCT